MYQMHLASNRQLASAAAAATAQQNLALLYRQALLCLEDADRRIAGVLLYLVEKLGASCHMVSVHFLRLPQYIIAAAAHPSRQRSNRVLRALSAARLIRVETNFICIIDVAGLTAVQAGAAIPKATSNVTSCKRRHPEVALDCTPIGTAV